MKVLLLNPQIPDYRIHIYNLIGEKLDLTIAHTGRFREEKGVNFKQILLNINKIGPFLYYPINLHKLCNKYDIIISEGDIHYIDRNILILSPFRKYKWITWGIGVSASYNKKFDQDKRFDYIRNFIFKKANAQVFYSDYPVYKHINAGFKKASLFVANNTTFVNFDEKKRFEKHKLLFVGTLYKQKRIYELLESYLEYCKSNPNCIPLEIIGDGDELQNISNWIYTNGLVEKIKLHGAIFNHAILEQHFREALACISPGQAGLSVLTSMGYGTPFITKKDAITGGEIFNIENGVNGVLYENSGELANILKDIQENKKKYVEMGISARNHYLKNRKPEQMMQGIIDACYYVLK